MDEVSVDTEGASLPDGIAVDEAAAYFGVIDSADIIVRLNQTDRLNGMGEFFSLTIDLVLQAEFGFEEAANRLGCEGGEIYYLLAGPFGLITISDPLRYYLGQENSEGEGLFRRFRAEGGIMNTDVIGGEIDFEATQPIEPPLVEEIELLNNVAAFSNPSFLILF